MYRVVFFAMPYIWHAGIATAIRDFGRRKIRARYEHKGCQCKSEPEEVQLYFPERPKNNPDGKIPNWVYYWRQTSGARGIVFQHKKTVPPRVNCAPGSWLDKLVYPMKKGPDGAAAAYDFCTDTLYITDQVLYTPGVQYSGCLSREDGADTVDYGIDCMVVTLLHENQHRLNFIQWWGPAMQRYRNDLDWDADHVPNSVEQQLPGCDPHNNSSPCASIPEFLRGRVPDNDYNTYSGSWGAWQPHKTEKEDWACPGQQIAKGTCPDH